MTVYTHKQAHVDPVLPDGQIRVVRIDLPLRHDLRILGAVIGHRNELRRNSLRQRFDRFSLAHRLLIPGPEDQRAREDRRILGLDQAASRFIDRLLLRHSLPHDESLTFRGTGHAPF